MTDVERRFAPLEVAGGDKLVTVTRTSLWSIEDLLLRARDGHASFEELTKAAKTVRDAFDRSA